jgi:3-oxoacyl-[acyl-carrier protein] reductase
MILDQVKIVITGAGSGFGRAMSLFFSENNADVYALDLNYDSLLQLKSENNKIHIFKCDVTNNEEVEAVIEELFTIDNKINILVNNAGVMLNSPLINILKRPDNRHDVELWKKIIDINQSGVFYMTRSFASKLITNRVKGVIINISSIAANGNIGQTAYSASKAAVESMTKVWAKELGSFGIRSVAIAPGFIDTNGTHNALEEKMLNYWVSNTPIKRTGKIEEIVCAVKFIIENDFVNGEVINVNGGLVI